MRRGKESFMKFEDLKVTVYADGAEIEAMKEEYKK